MRTLFSSEKMFGLDLIYNSQNDCTWAVNREEENQRGGKNRKVYRSDDMVSRILRGRFALVLFEKGTLDHHRYIKEVLSVTLRYENSKFGNNWTFQQDNGTPHIHQEP